MAEPSCGPAVSRQRIKSPLVCSIFLLQSCYYVLRRAVTCRTVRVGTRHEAGSAAVGQARPEDVAVVVLISLHARQRARRLRWGGAQRGPGRHRRRSRWRRVEEADEGADVLGFPGLFEVPDDAGLPGLRGRGCVDGADAAAGCGGQLAACRGGAAGDLGHFGEGGSRRRRAGSMRRARPGSSIRARRGTPC
jgi:hypothetical protein